jgi:hypothetical protein
VARERPDAVVADEIASRAGAFALAKDLRGAPEPYPGAIVIRWIAQDAWLAVGREPCLSPTDPSGSRIDWSS